LSLGDDGDGSDRLLGSSSCQSDEQSDNKDLFTKNLNKIRLYKIDCYLMNVYKQLTSFMVNDFLTNEDPPDAANRLLY